MSNWDCEYIRQVCVFEFKIKTQSAVCTRGNIEAFGLSAPVGAGARCTRCPPWKGRLYPQLSGTMPGASGVESRRNIWVRKSTQVSSGCVLFCWQPIFFSIFPDTFSAEEEGRKREQGEEKEEREVKEKERAAKEGRRIVLESAPL
jgi:hypothetical protein